MRSVPILHRNAITAIDKLSQIGTITPTGTVTGGFLANSALYYYAAIPYNKYGGAGVTTISNSSTGASATGLRLPFAQVVGADGYDIYLSTAAGAPLWVGRVTEAQRASGILVGVGNVLGALGAGGAAGSVDVLMQGTGLAANVAPATSNNAYTPGAVASIGFINCAGKAKATIKVALVPTDYRSLPALNIVAFTRNQYDGFWDQTQLVTVPTLTTTGQCLRQEYKLADLDGSLGLVVLIDSIAGYQSAASVVVELS